MTRPLLAIEGLSKTFPGLQALDDVDFAVDPGRDRGAGRPERIRQVDAGEDPRRASTQPDPGARIEGRAQVARLDPRHPPGPRADPAAEHGREPRPRPPPRRARRAARPGAARRPSTPASCCAQFDAAFDVTVPVAQLTPAERTIVAIARALDGWEHPQGLLILDEPTAALHSDEVGRLFTAVPARRRRAAPA